MSINLEKCANCDITISRDKELTEDQNGYMESLMHIVSIFKSP